MYKSELNLLPAFHGDCIHLRFGEGEKYYNIIVDSGPAEFAGRFCKLLKDIKKRGEKVDLLCFTHIDDDHIKGAQQTFLHPLFDQSVIGKIWMNLPGELEEKKAGIPVFRPTTVGTAFDLWKLIVAHEIPYEIRVMEGEQMQIGPALVEVFLPNAKNMEKFLKKWKEDAQKPANKKHFALMGGGRKDSNPYNGSSITLCVSIGEQNILLTGDAFADDLENCCDKYLGDRKLTLVKLPHHGSSANISKRMLEKMKCQHFLISTHETTKRPAENTFRILSEYGAENQGVTLYGNYRWGRMDGVGQGLSVVPLKDRSTPVLVEGVEVYSE